MSIDLRLGNCVDIMKSLPDSSVDLVVTSPPYDNLRNYNNSICWNFIIFQEVAMELYRVLKSGGVIIWVVGDKTENGTESGTSFRQALYFKEIGFNIHDTMIFRKENYIPLTHNRYEQEFEYMFCFSKGVPKTFNPIKVPCKCAGEQHWSKVSFYKSDNDDLTDIGNPTIKDEKIRGNIFTYVVGSTASGKWKHPAMFPLDLAKDQITSWSNKGDTVLDCFMGSGTTGVACKLLDRNFIGIELVEDYYSIAKNRIDSTLHQISLF